MQWLVTTARLYFCGWRSRHSVGSLSCDLRWQRIDGSSNVTDAAGAAERAERRRLEAMHSSGAKADMALIMKHLGSEDRFLRYAARVALEFQPIASWRDAAFAVKGAKASMNAMLAIAHQGSKEDVPRLIAALNQLKLGSLSEEDQLIWLRVLQVAFARHGQLDASPANDRLREQLVGSLDTLYPCKSFPVNAELAQLLVYLESPTVITKTLALMEQLGPEPIPDWGHLVSRNAGYGGTVGKMWQICHQCERFTLRSYCVTSRKAGRSNSVRSIFSSSSMRRRSRWK